MIETGLVDENIIFSSVVGPDDISIVELLEPIETIIKEKYFSLSSKNEWLALRLLNHARKWQKKRSSKIDVRFSLPANKKLYKESLRINNQ